MRLGGGSDNHPVDPCPDAGRSVCSALSIRRNHRTGSCGPWGRHRHPDRIVDAKADEPAAQEVTLHLPHQPPLGADRDRKPDQTFRSNQGAAGTGAKRRERRARLGPDGGTATRSPPPPRPRRFQRDGASCSQPPVQAGLFPRPVRAMPPPQSPPHMGGRCDAPRYGLGAAARVRRSLMARPSPWSGMGATVIRPPGPASRSASRSM